MTVTQWFVNATRNNTSIRLVAPRGEIEAGAMAIRLRADGWNDVHVEEMTTMAPTPMLSVSLPKRRYTKTQPHPDWPDCERCTRKHSPHQHDADGCSHCSALCRKPSGMGPTRAKRKTRGKAI